MTALAKVDVTAIIASGGTLIANQRVVNPLLDRGAIAHVLVLNGNTVIAQHLLPIDHTLPSDAHSCRADGNTTSAHLDHAATPSTS